MIELTIEPLLIPLIPLEEAPLLKPLNVTLWRGKCQ
jgi:hypothetical protein